MFPPSRLFLLLLLGASLAGAASPPAASPPSRSSLIEHFLSAPVGTVPLAQASGVLREFTLEVRAITAEIAPGVTVAQWAFGPPGGKATVPGPTLRVNRGDRVRITLRNTHDQPHTLHFHGIASVAQGMDGVGHTSLEVLPGASYTYEFVASEKGSFMYHCHVQSNRHMDLGMYGPLIVEDPLEKPLWSREYTLMLDEWDSRQDPGALIHRSSPDFFLVNGQSYPLIPNLKLPEGESALLRLIHAGDLPHSLHLHGSSFLVLGKDGHDLPLPYVADTLPMLPGERYELLVRGRDGTFPLHDHILSQNTNAGVYPGGIHLMLEGGPEKDAQGQRVPARAGATPPAPSTPINPAPANPAPLDHGAMGHGSSAPGTPASPPTTPAPASPSVALTDQREVRVSIGFLGVSPQVIRIRRGTTVTWVNGDRIPHTVTEGPPGGPPEKRRFDSSGQAQGQQLQIGRGSSWSHTFTEAGTYRYHCIPHPNIVGTVIVE